MIESNYKGLSVINTGMADVSLDETVSAIKFTNGNYVANSKEIKGIPSAFRTVLTEFVPTDGATWIFKDGEEGKKELAYMVLWDNNQNPIEVVERTIKNKKELFKPISVDDFAKQIGLEDGINRNIIASIAKELLTTALKEGGKIAQRMNIAMLRKANEDKVIVIDGTNLDVVVNDATKAQVQAIMQDVYKVLEPSEMMVVDQQLNTRFRKEKSLKQKDMILKELKNGTFENYDIKTFVPFSPATFSALEKNVDKMENNSYKNHVEYIQSSLNGGELGEMYFRTNIGGYVIGTVPSLDNESMVVDMRMLPTSSAFDKNENFSKESETLASRKEIKKLYKEAKENPAVIPALKGKYLELFDEIMPQFTEQKVIDKYKRELENNDNAVLSYAFLAEVTNTAILDEKTNLKGGYDTLYTMKKTKDSKRPILANNGLPYNTAMLVQNSNSFDVVATMNAHQDIKKKNMGTDPDIIHTTQYKVASIQDKHNLVTVNHKKTIPEKIGYLVQDILRMDEKGEFQYIVKEDGEDVTKTKVVNVADSVAKINKVLAEETALKTNTGISTALNELSKSLNTAIASGNAVVDVKKAITDANALYFPLISACSEVNTLAIAKLSNRNFIANLYRNEINAEIPNLYKKLEEGKIEDIDYINITPKTSKKEDRVRHYKTMSNILLSVVSNFEFGKQIKERIENNVVQSQEWEQYVKQCRENQKEPTQNLIGFDPKIKESMNYASALKNRIDGRLSTYNKTSMCKPADSLFLKDGKVIVNGQEYDSKLINSFDDMNTNIKEVKSKYETFIKAQGSVIPTLIEVLKEKAQSRSNNYANTFNSIIGAEEKKEQEAVKDMAQQMESGVAEKTPEATAVQSELAIETETVEEKQEVAKTLANTTIEQEAEVDASSVVIDEEEALTMEADEVFGSSNDVEDEISAMLGDEEDFDDELFNAPMDNYEEDEDVSIRPA